MKITKKFWIICCVVVLTLIGAFLGIYGNEQCNYISQNKNYPTETVKASITEDGEYQTKEEVATYIHKYQKLPKNYLTKQDAKEKGWISTKGNLRDILPGASIGGDYFEDRNHSLPANYNRDYYECDINYEGGFRNAERIVYSNDNLIFYTDDHYTTYTMLNVEE